MSQIHHTPHYHLSDPLIWLSSFKSQQILSIRAIKYIVIVLVAVTAFGLGVWVNTSRHGVTLGAADIIYAIDLPDLQGKQQKLSQWRGKVLVVNFWATWCAPCREEIPVFVRMQDKYGVNGLQFVGISIDQVDKTADFARNFGINYPTLIGTFDTIELSRAAGNAQRALPFTVILDRKGQIVATELGGLSQKKLEILVNPLL